MAKVAVAANIHAAPVHVWHSGLTRETGGSAYLSECPKCKEGVLPCARDATYALINVDRCTLCGQVFIYEDEEIAGQKVVRVPRTPKAPEPEGSEEQTFWTAVRDNDT